ncbi:hypothetical protein GH816_02950 [Betaproteobacteria bacterium LSUCC0115]|nr:hypothetical protein [Burkholderiales bacterium LSUCC0115]
MTLRVYYVNGFDEGEDPQYVGLEHAIYYSDRNSNTGTWSDRAPIKIEGQIDGNAVDPNLIQLEDGRYLLTYMRGQFTQTNPEPVSTIYSAWSYNGVDFYNPQVLYKPSSQASFGLPAVTDPSLVQLTDGSWLLAISNPSSQSAGLYTSSDGVNFTANGVSLPAFSPDFQLLANGNVRIVYADAAAGGFGSQVSSDGGETWVVESGARFAGPYFDPSVFRMPDGSWGMFYKTQTTVEGQQSSPLLGHLTSLATSSDGTTFTTQDAEFAAAASVAEGIDFSGLTVSESLIAATSTNDTIAVGEQGAHVRAGNGIDTVSFAIASSALTLEQDFFNEGDWVGHLLSDANVAYLLQDVERFVFTDKSLAVDLDGHAGQVAKILGAVFGSDSVANAEYVGIGLDLLDGGMSYSDLAALAVSVTGNTSSTDICNLLWENVIGSSATATDIAPFKSMLDTGQLSIGQLTTLAADTSFNTDNIDLVGLSEIGLEFI